MANEFRVKNGLIVDELTSGAGVLKIVDSNITSDDGSIEVTVVDGQTVSLGKIDEASASIVVAPHGTAGSEKITVLNTSGTSATEGSAAVQLTATAGGINLKSGLNGAGAILLTADGGTSETIKIHADQGSGAGSIELTSDAGGIDINAGAGITLDATTMSIDGTDDSNITVTGSAKDLDIAVAGGGTQELRLTSAGTGTSALHLNATAGAVDIDANGTISIEAGEDIEIGTALADGQSITIGKSGAAEMVLTPHGTAANEKITITNTAGTANDAFKIATAAGGITLDAELDIALDANGGDVFVKDNGAVYGSLTNSSNALHIYSGTTAVLKMGTNSVVSNASFMGDLTVGGTDQTGSAANRFQVNSPSGSGETIEARIRTSIESPSTVSGVANVLVLDNGNKESVAAQGMITTIGTAAATDQNTQAWFWGRMDSYNRYSLGYTGGKHWDTTSFAGGATSPEKAAQSVFQVDEYGRILVGANNSANAGTAGPLNMITVHIDDDDGQDGMIFTRQDSSTASGDLLGAIGFDSTDGNVPSLATEASAYIAAYATEAHSGNNKGGALVFGVTHLTDDDDTTSQEVMRISSDSATSAFVQIGNVDDSGGELRFVEDTDNDDVSNVAQYAAFRAPSAITTSYTMILPAVQGTAGQVLDIASVNSNEITLAWDDVATGGGGDVSAGSSFNTAGVLMAASGGGAKEIDIPGATLTTNGQGLTVGGNFTTGVDDTGVDVRFFSATASEGVLYDASEDELALLLTTKLKFHDVGGGEEIFASDDGDLEINAGATLAMTSPQVTFTSTTGVAMDTPSFIVASSTSDKPDMVIANTHADATGPSLEFSLDTANSAANNDVAGTIHFKADDAGNNQTEYGRIQVKANAVAAGSESGKMSFGVATTTSGAYADIMTITGGADAANSTVTIAGNLTVSGETTQVNTTSITVEDALIELGMVDGAAPSSDTSIDLGMLVNYYSSSAAKKAGFYWDSSTTAWSLSEVVTESSQVLTPTAGATEMRFLYDAANYFSIGVAADGATTLQTVDSDGAAGNLQITADGTAELAGTTVTLDSAGDITLNADGADVLFADGSTSYGSISHTSTGIMTLKSATDKELEIRSERDMTFVIDDDAEDSNSFFTFKAEDNTLADSTNFDARVGPVTTKYYSTSLLIGQTEFGKGVIDDPTTPGAEGTLFTYNGTVFGAAEVVIHITDGTTDQVNKMLICSDTGGGNDVAYSNYSVIYSDGSTELGTVRATASSGTVSVHVDADDNDTVTYAVTFLA